MCNKYQKTFWARIPHTLGKYESSDNFIVTSMITFYKKTFISSRSPYFLIEPLAHLLQTAVLLKDKPFSQLKILERDWTIFFNKVQLYRADYNKIGESSWFFYLSRR